jgi:hypothetical protein
MDRGLRFCFRVVAAARRSRPAQWRFRLKGAATRHLRARRRPVGFLRLDAAPAAVAHVDGSPPWPGSERDRIASSTSVAPAGVKHVLRLFEATSADISDLGEEHGHRVLRVSGKGGKVVLVPLPPAGGRAIDRATDHRDSGPVLLSSHGMRMDRHAATPAAPAAGRDSGNPDRPDSSSPHAPAHIRHDHARARSCIRCIIPRKV